MDRLRSLGAMALVVGLVSSGCAKRDPSAPPDSYTDAAILAAKPAGTNAIIVRAIGFGSGTIGIEDPSQTCVRFEPEDSHYSLVCFAYVAWGTASVTVNAAAVGDSRFQGWGAGPCSGSMEGSCAVPMDRDRTLTIGFAPGGATGPRGTYRLTVHVLGFVDGDISAPPGVGLVCQSYADTEDVVSLRYARACTAVVPSTTPPTEVTLTATPAASGTQFSGWGGSCTGGGTCTVTMDRDRGVTAGFTRGPAACTAPFVPSGSGCVCPAGYHPVGGTCAADLAPDTASPLVFLTSPLEGDTLSGDLVVTASVVDDRGVGAVTLVVDGAQTPYQLTVGPSGAYSTPVIASTTMGAGSHTLRVCATDTSGNVGCSAVITVTVAGPAQPGATWSAVPNPDNDPLYGHHTLYGVRGDSADRVWAVGHGVVLAWDGTRWTILASSSDPYYAIWGLPQSDFWIFSARRQAWRCDLATGACSAASFPGHYSIWYGYDVMGAWGSAPDDVWAVDAYGFALHWDGTTWVEVGGELNDRWWQNSYGTWFHDRWPLHGIWGSSASSVWAVGDNGAIVHWDGLAWSEPSRPTSSHLHGVWGSSANDVWAVGTAGTILHWDGGAWSSVPSGTTSDLTAVWGSSAVDVWAVGSGGTIVHWNGARWTTDFAGPAVTLRAVWGSSAGDVWAVGDGGTILRRH